MESTNGMRPLVVVAVAQLQWGQNEIFWTWALDVISPWMVESMECHLWNHLHLFDIPWISLPFNFWNHTSSRYKYCTRECSGWTFLTFLDANAVLRNADGNQRQLLKPWRSAEHGHGWRCNHGVSMKGPAWSLRLMEERVKEGEDWNHVFQQEKKWVSFLSQSFL